MINSLISRFDSTLDEELIQLIEPTILNYNILKKFSTPFLKIFQENVFLALIRQLSRINANN